LLALNFSRLVCYNFLHMESSAESKSRPAVSPVILAILDGWGEGPAYAGNAIKKAKLPFMNRVVREYPYGQLYTHGRYVGLLPDQAGNSEAGHMNIGAGRIVRQEVVTVSEAIKDHTFFKNTAFLETLKHAKKYGTIVHVMGLLSNGNSAHSNPEHLYAMLKMLREQGVSRVRLHIFTDGRDSMPFSAVRMLHELEQHLTPGQEIASVTGRFYAMDRNKLWKRTELAYRAIAKGEGVAARNAHTAILRAYNRGETDEFILPTVIVGSDDKPKGVMSDNDVMFFFNLRSDRARQITKTFVQTDFEKRNENSFKRINPPNNIRFCAMTEFGPDLPNMYTAFPSIYIRNGITETLSHIRQFYIGESEKYAHVTYFMNGGSAEPRYGEERLRVPSQFVPHHDMRPEMRANEITDEVIRRLDRNQHDLYVINYANADMVGHTGNIEATVKACEAVDRNLHRLARMMFAKEGCLLVVADHGNAEMMREPMTGEPMTEHSTYPVPFVAVCECLKGRDLGDGVLADVVPTILEIMDIPKPPEMTGFSLLR
jgi:2,3-bisphosphoglycerate-independent phosphoglycerate mutase